MSNKRYLELSSFWRDRKLYPNPSNFIINLSMSGRATNSINAQNATSLATPCYNFQGSPEIFCCAGSLVPQNALTTPPWTVFNDNGQGVISINFGHDNINGAGTHEAPQLNGTSTGTYDPLYADSTIYEAFYAGSSTEHNWGSQALCWINRWE